MKLIKLINLIKISEVENMTGVTLKNETLEDIKNNRTYISLMASDLTACLNDEQAIRLAESILFHVRMQEDENQGKMLSDLEKESEAKK